jgi:hypothetical protein
MIAAISDADRMRTRANRMLELANRAHCEKNYDFARLLTQLATEALKHAQEIKQPEQTPSGLTFSGRRKIDF